MSNLRSRAVRAAPVVQKRPGEHHYVNVDVQNRVSTSGETATYVGIALGSAPVPDRKYVADTCYLIPDQGGGKIIFGQMKLAQDQIRSAVVIKMSCRGIGFLLRAVDDIA